MSVPVSFAIGMDKTIAALSQIVQRIPPEHPDTIEDLEAYYDVPLKKAFPAPPTPEHAYLSRVRRRGSVSVEDFRFDSAFVPWTDAYRARHERDYAANKMVVGRILRHTDGFDRSFVVYIHGWMQPGASTEERLLFPKFMKTLDVDVCHLYLPFHGKRKPPSSVMHGDFFWTSDLVRTVEAIRQSVTDVRSVVRYLKHRYHQPVGLAGVSLGGVITMLTSCVEEELAFAVPIIAHTDLADAIDRAPILTRMNDELKERGISKERLREMERRLGLSAMKPIIPNERMLWINAREDQFLHADAVERQWESWGRPPIRWYGGSHMSIVFEIDQMIAWMSEFLDSLQLVPRHGIRRKRAA